MQENPNFWQRLAALEPAVVRGIVVAIVALVGLVTGKIIGDDTVDTIVDILLILLPIVTGFFIKSAVTPNAKVIAFKPDPVENPDIIHPGEATIEPTVEQKQELYEAGLRPAA